ncbi:MAG: hypothetical protein V3T84_02245 [Phycisphaerales bacterium]
MDAEHELVIEVDSTTRKGVVALIVKHDDRVLHVDEIRIRKDSERRGFIKAVCSKAPALDAQTVESRLLEVVNRQNGSNGKPSSSELTEVGLSCIVRPERFIRSEISGLTVAMVGMAKNEPVGQWVMYLRWAEGKRERLALPESIELNDGSRLWIQPQLTAPSNVSVPRWSAGSRKAWLNGDVQSDPAELLSRIFERIAYFLELPSEHAKGIASTLGLWSILTYVYLAWDAVPYLYFGGPAGSGKSRAFEVLSRLVFRPLSSSSMTGPALFRTLHNQGGTLLLDEAERLRESSPEMGELRSMLLAGYKRGGRATRLEGENFQTKEFDVYGPKAMACIAGLPPALSSRCIPVMMFRAGPGSVTPRRRIDDDPNKWQVIRDGLHVIALEHGSTWLELAQRVDVCPPMTGRHFELWQPLLALAAWLEESGASGLLELMQQHALTTIEAQKDDQTPAADVLLLRTLSKVALAGEEPTCTDLLNRARDIEPDLFRRWTATGVGKALRRYDIQTHHSGERQFRDVLPQLARVQSHYDIDLGIPDGMRMQPDPSTGRVQPVQSVQTAGQMDTLGTPSRRVEV